MHAALLSESCTHRQLCGTFNLRRAHGPLPRIARPHWVLLCAAERRCNFYDLSERQVPYDEAWLWQQRLVAQARERAGNPAEACDDTLLLLQHNSVYTLGAGSTEEHLLFPAEASPLPLLRVERGGEVTYHGPGQLVLYPVLNLRRHCCDLHWYMRSLEEVAVRALQTVSGLQGERIEGLTGVWVGGRKVAAIGVRARQWITYHGMALNVITDLAPFSAIVPCGIAGRDVTSVQQELSMQQAASGGEQLLQEYSYALMDAFEEVFDVTLHLVIGEPDGDTRLSADLGLAPHPIIWQPTTNSPLLGPDIQDDPTEHQV